MGSMEKFSFNDMKNNTFTNYFLNFLPRLNVLKMKLILFGLKKLFRNKTRMLKNNM